MKEKQRKLKKIKKIMDACCAESLSADSYTIKTCKVEYDTEYLLMFVYNCKHEIIEARLSNYDDMIVISEKIRQKTKIHLSQCSAICNFIAKKHNIGCMIEVVDYRHDILKVKLNDNNETTIQGTYVEIIDKL